MLGRKEEINLQLHQILDSLVLAFLFWFSHFIRFSTQISLNLKEIAPFTDFVWIMAIIVPFTPLVLEFQGYYHSPLQKTLMVSIRQILQSMVYVGVVIGACVIFLKWHPESRSVLLLFTVLGTVGLLAKEAIYKSYLRKRLLTGQLKEPVVLIGSNEDIEETYNNIPLEQRLEMDVVARMGVDSFSTDELVQVIHDRGVGKVVFAADHLYFGQIEDALAACEAEGVEVWLSADFFQTSVARPGFEMIGHRPMLVFRSTPEISWALLLKGIIDRIGAFLIIVATSPLWLLVAIGIKMSSKGPVFFRQRRGGLYGRPFEMIKFRTMRPDAEALREELAAENEMSGPVFKVERDPRVFPLGRILRQMSIDELPQLINVVFGEMSLVGPRPLPIYEVEQIEKGNQRRRLSVKPGLTCLWQIGGRSRITSFDEWVALDLEYIDNWSLWLDFKILLKTIPVVLLGSGAK